MTSIPQNSPFKLLQSYEKEDIRFFFGREKETRQLYDALMRSKLMLIYGASGTGKTSLIQCGLQGMYSPRDWMPILVRRKDNFLDSLREELEQRYQERFEDFRQQQLEWYPEEPAPEPETFDTLRDLIRALFNLSYVPIYLILDQFEEVFTLGERSEQDEFFRTLKELDLFSEELFCKILIITREEYIAHFYRYESLLPFLFENRFRVEKMRDEQLLSVVNRTLTAAYPGYPAFDVEPGVDHQILENLTDQRGEVDLTTLQVYLDRLYQEDKERIERASDRKYLKFDQGLVGKHKIENVLADFLNDQVVQVTEELQRQYPRQGDQIQENLPLQVLFQLVTDQGTKQNKNAQEIQQALQVGKAEAPLPMVESCLAAFAGPDSRILNQLRFAKTADQRYEIVHDRLAEQIFKKFSAAELRRREAITTVQNKLKRFKEAPTPKAQRQEYLSMGELELISQSINIQALGKGMKELKQFHEDSQRYHATQRRRRRMVTGVSVVASIIFLAVAVFAALTTRRAQSAEEEAQEYADELGYQLEALRRSQANEDKQRFDDLVERGQVLEERVNLDAIYLRAACELYEQADSLVRKWSDMEVFEGMDEVIQAKLENCPND